MINYDELRKIINNIEDPHYKKPLGELEGIKKLVIGPTGIVELEIQLKDRLVNETKIKPVLVKLIKQELGFPGLKLSFTESDYIPSGSKQLIYIAVCSGKGGVGKSSVTANLAKAMLRLGVRAGVIDADIYGASIPQILNVPQSKVHADENESMIPLIGEGIETMSVYFFMGDKPLMWRGVMLGKMLDHFFHGVKWNDETEVILIDLPPGTGDVAIDIQKMCPQTKVLVVTTPHINASSVALKAGTGSKALGHEILGVIENMSYYMNPVNFEKDFIFGNGGGELVAQKLETELLAQIPIKQPDDKTKYTFDYDEVGLTYNELAMKILSMIGLR